jgi:hypothetical protein
MKTLAMMLAILACKAPAAELRPVDVRHGTAGLDRMQIRVMNATGAPLACEALIAHWYSETVARIPSGGSAMVELWRDPATGVVALLNALGDNLPLEALFCGYDGRAYATRAPLDFRHASEPAQDIVCRPEGPLLACR